jgi:D-hydroxyproline dehydrogenase subunit gamma
MMRRLDEAGPVVHFTFDGRDMEARDGDSVAAALFATGSGLTRSSVISGELRAPYCMMGICFECLAEIDGVPNRQACMVRVRPGMNVSSSGVRDA